VTAYVIGQGEVSPPVPTGRAAALSPLSYPVAPVELKIASVPAEIQFAGLAPGFVGLLQVNFRVPAVAPGQLSVEVTVGGVVANLATLSIAKP